MPEDCAMLSLVFPNSNKKHVKEWALEKAKDILREADHLLGVKTIKADWS